MFISSISIPDITPRKYNSSIMDIFSLIFLLFLINTSIAAPDDVNSPQIGRAHV